MGPILGNHGNAAVVVIGNDVIRLNSLLAATGNEDLPGGFGLSEMLDHWDVWLPRLESVVGAFENNVSIRNACEIEVVSEVTWLPPIQRPRKLICMGINYAGHAAEVSSEPLKAPYSFIKTTSNTLRGSGATITLLDIAQMNDWEVELTVVIGRAARRVEEAGRWTTSLPTRSSATFRHATGSRAAPSSWASTGWSASRSTVTPRLHPCVPKVL
jgi:hypothetical protein